MNSHPLHASIITFNFSGQIGEVQIYNDTEVPTTSVGDLFTGSFSFDSETPLLRITEPGKARYDDGYMRVYINEVDYNASSNSQLQVLNDYVLAGGTFDDFFLSMTINVESGDYWLLQMYMRDYSASILSSLSLPTTTEIQALMDINPLFALRRFSSTREEIWFARGNVTNYSSSTIPLPAAAWLFVGGLLGLVGFARRKNTHKEQS